MQNPTSSLVDEIAKTSDALTAMRRDLHAHPEIGLEEHRTAKIVSEYLEAMGVTVHGGIGITGVVGVLEGASPGKTIGLRADMDALPMTEKTNLPWSSKHHGLMHACGHDAHTTMLLGAARHLVENPDFAGTAVFIFQPAEEGLGGARAMIADGLFDRFRCDEIYAIHNDPSGRLGEVRVNPFIAYAGADFFDVSIAGKGAHAAYPDQGNDVLSAGAALIEGFNAIISRSLPSSEQAVLSVARFTGGTAYNVLPDEAQLGGTMRFLSDDAARLIRRRMKEVCQGVAAQFAVQVDLNFQQVFSVLENDPGCARSVMELARPVVGPECVVEISTPDMGSEDFADMLKTVPGAYFTLGHGGTVPLHNPAFDIDDDMLPIGAALFSAIMRGRGGSDYQN